MQVICKYSSLSFNVEHFPGFLQGSDACHPIFYLPQKKLLSHLGTWSASKFSDIDSYLLYVALLKSSDLVTFRVPTIRTDRTASLIANNMEHLAAAVCKLNAVSNPSTTFPHNVITIDTRDLTNTPYWIENWVEAYKNYKSGVISAHDSSKLNRREQALHRMVLNSHKPVASYARQIAEWAAVAGSFPESMTVNRMNGFPCTISEYWQDIIIKCTQDAGIFAINRADLDELIEHCRVNIIFGTIYSAKLFGVLDKAEEKLRNFLGLGDLDISGTVWTFPTSEDDAQSLNLKAAIASAPQSEPRLDQYPSKFQYNKAKLNWDMAQKHGRSAAQDLGTSDPQIREREIEIAKLQEMNDESNF